MQGDRLMRAALGLAERGMFVFPLRPGTKVPAVRRDWEGCATTDVEQIERWWVQAPYNIGVATGPSRLLVVDLDVPKQPGGRHGSQVLADRARDAGGEVPRKTFTVVTPSGGLHLYLRASEGVRMSNTAGRLGPCIDTRGTGGYVVGPASRVERRWYRLVNRAEPAAMPSWMVEALRPRVPEQRAAAVGDASAYVRAAIEGEVRRVAEALPGCRNSTVFQAAARLGRFVRSGHLREPEVVSSLTTAAARHVGVRGFTDDEVRRAIRSGLRAADSHADSGADRAELPRSLRR